jgi:hypothetical protein
MRPTTTPLIALSSLAVMLPALNSSGFAQSSAPDRLERGEDTKGAAQ